MGVIRRLASAPSHTGIVALHGALESFVDEDVQLNHLRANELERFLDRIADLFEIVAVDDIIEPIRRGGAPPPRAIALTFDDGYRNNLTVVEPLLRARGFPFSVFVTTRFVDEGVRLPTYVMRVALKLTGALDFVVPGTGEVLPLRDASDRTAAIARLRGRVKSLPQSELDVLVGALRCLLCDDEWSEADARFESEAPLTWGEVRQLASDGVTIGSHCHDHAILHSAQPAAEVRRQLRRSKELLENALSQPCDHFGYPNGTPRDISADAVRLVGEAGYSSGLTNIAGTIDHTAKPLFLPRLYVSRDIDGAVETARRLDRQDARFARAYAEVLGV